MGIGKKALVLIPVLFILYTIVVYDCTCRCVRECVMFPPACVLLKGLFNVTGSCYLDNADGLPG